MMRYGLALLLIIMLIVVETSVLPYLPQMIRFYDFLVLFAVYLSLYQSLSAGLPLVVIAGLAMDVLSGAPLGIYMASYLWVFLVFRRVPTWVRIGDHTLFFILSLAGVAIQNLIFGMAAWSISRVPFFTVHTGMMVLFQLLWTVVTAPFFWFLFQSLLEVSNRGSSGSEQANGV